MDQESFRHLLSASGSGTAPRGNSSSGPRENILSNTSSKSKKVDASQPVFKPRKVKKADAEGKYRNRAAERREGGGNDYAHVEAVLEDFERRNTSNEDKKVVEEQRKYLGGDGEHSILVKGLDMALLEQNKARAILDSNVDDDTLEQAYLEASIPKKRTRADIINELKQKRSQLGQVGGEAGKPNDDAKVLEDAKRQGKFKPIGFKPIGVSEEKEKKKKKKKLKAVDGAPKEGEGRKAKKRKVEVDEVGMQGEGKTEATSPGQPTLVLATPASKTNLETELEPEPVQEDFDIFAGVDDYGGIDLGDDDDDDEEEGEMGSEARTKPRGASPRPTSTSGSRGWFVTEDEVEEPHTPPNVVHGLKNKTSSPSPGRRRQSDHNIDKEDTKTQEFDDEEEQQPVRLLPLSSSAVPSIRDILAMDEAAEAADKRRKRKEKKKAGSGGGGGSGKSMEEKVNRDYQRLQSYTSKKEASGSR